jgi:hypothetical protein
MLWVIHHAEEHYQEGGEEKTRMVLAAVHRFQTGDAAMKRFCWSTAQLGQAETEGGLTYIGEHSLRHTFTTAHAMPEKAMISTGRGFKLLLHQARDGEDFIKEWDLPPGREEIMKAVAYDAQR